MYSPSTRAEHINSFWFLLPNFLLELILWLLYLWSCKENIFNRKSKSFNNFCNIRHRQSKESQAFWWAFRLYLYPISKLERTLSLWLHDGLQSTKDLKMIMFGICKCRRDIILGHWWRLNGVVNVSNPFLNLSS